MAAMTRQTHPLVRKLDARAALTDDEAAAILALPARTARLGPDQEIVRDGDRPSRCTLLLEGFACRQKVTPRGTRQILAFHVPGDFPDLQSLHLGVMDHVLATVLACQVAFVDHEDIRALTRSQPRLADLLWRDTLVDAAIFREWITNIGRRDARRRVAHLLCELHAKLRAVGLADGDTMRVPITQEKLADATGLSAVHMNRTIQELRGEGLIVMRGSTVTIPDREALAELGEFDALYLHMGYGARRDAA